MSDPNTHTMHRTVAVNGAPLEVTVAVDAAIAGGVTERYVRDLCRSEVLGAAERLWGVGYLDGEYPTFTFTPLEARPV